MVAEAASTDSVFLDGEGVYLRGLRREDATGNWYGWFNDHEVTRFMVRGAFPTTVEGHLAFLAEMDRSVNDLVLAICERASSEHIGNIGLHRIDWVNRVAELGVVIGEKAYWGRGHGTEACRLVLAHGFGRLNLHKVFLGVHAGHAAAMAAYESAGFTREAVLREEIYRDGTYHDKVLMAAFAARWSPKA